MSLSRFFKEILDVAFQFLIFGKVFSQLKGVILMKKLQMSEKDSITFRVVLTVMQIICETIILISLTKRLVDMAHAEK